MTDRQRFEAWLSAEPYLRSDIERFPADHEWAGQYENPRIQAAWEAWQASQKVDRSDDPE